MTCFSCICSQLDLSPQQNNNSGHGPRGAVLDPASYQAAFPRPSTHQTPVLGQPAVENLRRLASRCINHPDSRIDVVRVEPGTAGRYKLVIVLESSDFL